MSLTPSTKPTPENNAWSGGPPKNLYPNNKPTLSIGKFRPSAPIKSTIRPQNTNFQTTTQTQKPPVRPGLEMVQTPRGPMPSLIAKSTFGPGGNQGFVRPKNGQPFNNNQNFRPNYNFQQRPGWTRPPAGGLNMNPNWQNNRPRWNNTNVNNPRMNNWVNRPMHRQPRPIGPRPTGFPPSMTSYIQRCFAQCKTDAEKDETEKFLKPMINDKMVKGDAWKINWQLEPLALEKLYPEKFAASIAAKRSASEIVDLTGNTKKQKLEVENGFNGDLKITTAPIGAILKATGGIGKASDMFGGGAFGKKLDRPDFLSDSKKSGRAARFQKENISFLQVKKKLTTVARNSPLRLNLAFEQEGKIHYKVIGTSTDIFKPYLRLTTAPTPSDVRTPVTLTKSLLAVKKKWRESVQDVESYRFVCDQLKSIRQDLTVQCIRNVFTVEVYETHCRIALDAGDHEEFNQCKSQLTQLYTTGIKSENRAEIAAYEIIYYLLTKNMTDMSVALSKLDQEVLQDSKVKLALKLRKCWASGNYTRFLRLYEFGDQGMRTLIDKFIVSQRRKGLEAMMKSYKPDLSIFLVQKQLGFKADKNKCLAFLYDQGAKVDSRAGIIDIKSPLSSGK